MVLLFAACGPIVLCVVEVVRYVVFVFVRPI